MSSRRPPTSRARSWASLRTLYGMAEGVIPRAREVEEQQAAEIGVREAAKAPGDGRRPGHGEGARRAEERHAGDAILPVVSHAEAARQAEAVARRPEARDLLEARH